MLFCPCFLLFLCESSEHLLGYALDEETPEMIMKKFEAMEQLFSQKKKSMALHCTCHFYIRCRTHCSHYVRLFAQAKRVLRYRVMPIKMRTLIRMVCTQRVFPSTDNCFFVFLVFSQVVTLRTFTFAVLTSHKHKHNNNNNNNNNHVSLSGALDQKTIDELFKQTSNFTADMVSDTGMGMASSFGGMCLCVYVFLQCRVCFHSLSLTCLPSILSLCFHHSFVTTLHDYLCAFVLKF